MAILPDGIRILRALFFRNRLLQPAPKTEGAKDAQAVSSGA